MAVTVNGVLLPERTITVRFTEEEATLQGITEKVTAASGDSGPLVLVDTRGVPYQECEGTTGNVEKKPSKMVVLDSILR